MSTAQHEIAIAPELRVVGLDLSLTATGIAYNTHTPDWQVRVLKTPAAKCDGCARLVAIRNEVLALAKYPRKADLVVIEGYSFSSVQGGERLGELGGVIRVALFECGIPFVEVPPSTLKIFATGRGNAKKPEVISNARERLGFTGFDDNAADATWLRAMGMHALGAPLADLPKTHLRALEKISWPIGKR